jgi:hypothetical protein
VRRLATVPATDKQHLAWSCRKAVAGGDASLQTCCSEVWTTTTLQKRTNWARHEHVVGLQVRVHDAACVQASQRSLQAERACISTTQPTPAAVRVLPDRCKPGVHAHSWCIYCVCGGHKQLACSQPQATDDAAAQHLHPENPTSRSATLPAAVVRACAPPPHARPAAHPPLTQCGPAGCRAAAPAPGRNVPAYTLNRHCCMLQCRKSNRGGSRVRLDTIWTLLCRCRQHWMPAGCHDGRQQAAAKRCCRSRP